MDWDTAHASSTHFDIHTSKMKSLGDGNHEMFLITVRAYYKEGICGC